MSPSYNMIFDQSVLRSWFMSWSYCSHVEQTTYKKHLKCRRYHDDDAHGQRVLGDAFSTGSYVIEITRVSHTCQQGVLLSLYYRVLHLLQRFLLWKKYLLILYVYPSNIGNEITHIVIIYIYIRLYLDRSLNQCCSANLYIIFIRCLTNHINYLDHLKYFQALIMVLFQIF